MKGCSEEERIRLVMPQVIKQLSLEVDNFEKRITIGEETLSKVRFLIYHM